VDVICIMQVLFVITQVAQFASDFNLPVIVHHMQSHNENSQPKQCRFFLVGDYSRQFSGQLARSSDYSGDGV